jgi:hypothetical protein
MPRLSPRLFVVFVVCALSGPPIIQAQNPTAQQEMNWDEFKSALMKRYDQKVVVARVPGLLAGEHKPGAFGVGKGESGVYWHHFHLSVALPNRVASAPFSAPKLSDMQQLDERTFGTMQKGLNVTAIEKGEPLKVSKFYVYGDYLEFVLATTQLGHWRDVDINKASTETTTTVSGGHVTQHTSVAGFGLVFRFHFDEQSVTKAGNYQAVVSEIGKYLLPQDEAEAALAAEKNVELEIGMPEESVVQRLGQPIRTVKVGDQKILKFKEMTVIIKAGKVAEVKVE